MSDIFPPAYIDDLLYNATLIDQYDWHHNFETKCAYDPIQNVVTNILEWSPEQKAAWEEAGPFSRTVVTLILRDGTEINTFKILDGEDYREVLDNEYVFFDETESDDDDEEDD